MSQFSNLGVWFGHKHCFIQWH